jgi:hypothetical protein
MLRRQLLAIFLLLCLVRTLLPEALVLALHGHEHTTEEPAHAKGWAKGKLLIGKQHQHCEVEQFYNVAYQAAALLVLPEPLVEVRYAPLPSPAAVRPAVPSRAGPTALRGPPFPTT